MLVYFLDMKTQWTELNFSEKMNPQNIDAITDSLQIKIQKAVSGNCVRYICKWNSPNYMYVNPSIGILSPKDILL